MNRRLSRLLLTTLLPSLLAACDTTTSVGTGKLALSAGGGAALQLGFPYKEGDTEYAMVDGWAVEFTKYVVVLGEVVLTDPEGSAVAGEWKGPAILDLKANAGAEQEVVTLELPARRLDVGFSLVKGSAAAENRTASAADAALVVQQGLTALIEGRATKGARTVRFSFPIAQPTRYSACINGKDQTQGIAVESAKTTGAFIYAHAIHLFWDTLSTGSERLRFDAFAAMAGADDLVTLDELAKQDLTDLRDEAGQPLRNADGSRVFYDDGGGLPSDQLDLRAFLLAAVRAGVHFNGVGLCTPHAP